MPFRGKKKSCNDKRGFLINGADSADRLRCNSSTSNHKYNEKKRRERREAQKSSVRLTGLKWNNDGVPSPPEQRRFRFVI